MVLKITTQFIIILETDQYTNYHGDFVFFFRHYQITENSKYK